MLHNKKFLYYGPLTALLVSPFTGGPAYYVLHPQKGITICPFLTYPAFKSREGIFSQTNLAE